MTSSNTALACVGLLLVLQLGCRGTNVLPDTEEARRLAADLRLQLHKASDASNQAVMAQTDEASSSSSRAAQKATANVDADAHALGPLLQRLRFSSEAQTLEEFKRHFSQYENLDRQILALAVENTNLKAQHLSFGPAREAADAFRDSVRTAVASIRGKDSPRARELGQTAILALREIQVLQAPHIAEADDAAMSRLEQEMTSLDRQAREALESLSSLAEANNRTTLDSALASLDKFRDISRQIVSLSRTNSNVRSLSLSLGDKPPLLGACDENLNALQQAVASEGALPGR
jgi:hypothetical protein